MLTVAYCRVSTEEQAEEGFSIDGQAEKLRAYASLRDLGPVTVIDDPGRSGKDLNRPGLQRLLLAVGEGHVSNVLVWRLDRLSRDLGDLIGLADRFGQAGVALHSFTEQLDLSSATGRMFYNILGSFAQFYREQLAENVKMGMQQAIQQGRWLNRPKTGYDLVDGELVPNADAEVVREIFRLRAAGESWREIESRTGVKYSTVGSIVRSRIYLGEVQSRDQWFPGRHESLVTVEEWTAAQRAHLPGRRRSTDLLSGRVRCGMCGRIATVQYNRDGLVLYRCHHRGQGCSQPARSGRGLLRVALMGLRLLGSSEELRQAIRRELNRAGRPARQGGGRTGQRSAVALGQLAKNRSKLLDLYYEEKISKDLFYEEERRIAGQIATIQRGESIAAAEAAHLDELALRFEQVAATLQTLDIDSLWAAATEAERRVLVEELVEGVDFYPDHFEVVVAGAPRLNVLPREVGMKESRNGGVGGPSSPVCDWRLLPWSEVAGAGRSVRRRGQAEGSPSAYQGGWGGAARGTAGPGNR